MIRVCLAMIHTGGGHFRQIHQSPSVEFGTPEQLPHADWLVVLDEPPRGYVTDVPRARRIAMLTESPEIKSYRSGYLEQFGTVISPMAISGYSGTVIRSHAALPWLYGHEDLADLAQLRPAQKACAVSVVITRKTKTPLHRARLKFVDLLQRRLGDRLHVFGRGFHEIGNKREAIDPFKYHLALENNAQENFWTEKIADAWLGWSLPLYSGCPNLTDYVPAEAFIRLELRSMSASIDTVERCLDEDPYDRRVPSIAVARQQLLEQHNMFALLERIILTLDPGAQGTRLSHPAELHSNGSFDLTGQLARRVRAAFNG